MVILVLALAIPTVFLRGTFQQRTVFQVNGLEGLASIEGVSVGPTIWSEEFNNVSDWTLSGASALAFLQVNRSLNFSVAFPYKSSPQALSVYRTVNLSLDRGSVVTFTITVSSGVSYGIRFFGVTANDVSFAAWREGSSFQHRPGLGAQETILSNLLAESALANPKLQLSGARITEILLYLEVPAFTSGDFALTLSDLHANSIVKTPADSREISGNFAGLIANLGQSVSGQGVFQVFVGLDIKGSPNLSYTLYLTKGASVLAQAYTYVPKAATTYELALLSPALVDSSPLFTGDIGASSLIVRAWAGEITFFRLVSVEIRFLSAPHAPSSALNPTDYSSLAFYYFLFLFVIPAVTVVLMVKVFKDEK